MYNLPYNNEVILIYTGLKTNNHLEGWHLRLKKVVGNQNPTYIN